MGALKVVGLIVGGALAGAGATYAAIWYYFAKEHL